MGGIITRFSQAPSSQHLTSGPCRHHGMHRFRVHSPTQLLATTAAKAEHAAAEPAAAAVALPSAIATFPTAAAAASASVLPSTAQEEAEKLFGRPDMHKLFVTGSGAMPSSRPTAFECARAHRSAQKAARVRATNGVGVPRPQQAVAADEEWKQFLAEQQQVGALQGGQQPSSLPFPVQSAEEEVLWRDVVRPFREGEE